MAERYRRLAPGLPQRREAPDCTNEATMTPEADARQRAQSLHLLASIFETHAAQATDERLRDAYNEAVLRITDAADGIDVAWQELAGVWVVPPEQLILEDVS